MAYIFGKEAFDSAIPDLFDGIAVGSLGTVTQDTTSKISGTNSALIHTGSGSYPQHAYLYKDLGVGNDRTSAYFQLKVYLPATFNFNGGFTILQLLNGSGTGNFFLQFDTGDNVSIHDLGNSFSQYGVNYVSENSVEKFEVFIDLTNGILKLWHNNNTYASPDYSQTGITFSSVNFRKFSLGNCTTPSLSDFYIDDVIMDSSFIGAGSGSGAVSQVAANLTATGKTQTISTIRVTGIAQSAANLTLTGGTQNVVTKSSNSQIAASLTATSGTQSVATVKVVSIVQYNAFLFVTNGGQVVSSSQVGPVSFSQVAANLTINVGAESITTIGSVSQVACNLTAIVGTQTVQAMRNGSVAQSSTNLTLTGRTQSITSVSSGIVSQSAANITATGGTPYINSNISIFQSVVIITLNTGIQIVAGGEGITTNWSQSSKEDTDWTDSIKETSGWTDSVKEDTAWTGSNAQQSSWSSDINIRDIILVDDLVALVDDTAALVGGYNPLLHSTIENINESLWS